jgi:hypothetical protein
VSPPGVLPRLPRSYRPLGARLAAAGVAAVLVLAVAFMWLAMPADVRAQFTAFQRGTLLVLLGGILVALYGVLRTVVRADARGLRVVNVFRERRLEWAEVLGVSLPRGHAWAVLDLADGTSLSAMALQGSDGARAVQAVRDLAALIEENTRIERDR